MVENTACVVWVTIVAQLRWTLSQAKSMGPSFEIFPLTDVSGVPTLPEVVIDESCAVLSIHITLVPITSFWLCNKFGRVGVASLLSPTLRGD